VHDHGKQADFHGNNGRQRQHRIQDEVRGRSWHEDHQGLHVELAKIDYQIEREPGHWPGSSFASAERSSIPQVSNLIHNNRLNKGGHFAVWEQPKLLVEELRSGLKPFRNTI
jgi:hypothetical protein